MSLARLVVTAVKELGRPKAEVARDFGVSRRWVHEIIKRFESEGEAGLEPRSRRPHSSPHRTPEEVDDRIVELRKSLAEHGLDAGAETIAFHLIEQTGRAPSVATIWRILCRRGFVTPQPQKRPKSSYTRFCADLPNEMWQADITHWSIAGGAEVEILNVLDDHSRLLVASDARRTTKAADVVETFHGAAVRHGFPAAMLTDNAAVFTGAFRGGGRCAIEVELGALGVRHVRSSPYHPQTCGKVERFHQTEKRWLAKQPPAADLGELQAQLGWFRSYYNTQRPHRALRRRTPATAYEARPKDSPSLPGFLAPPHYRVRQDRVDAHGKLTLRYNSRLHHIGMGRRHSGVKVLLLVRDLEVRILTEDGELLRELTLDPAKDYQRQG